VSAQPERHLTVVDTASGEVLPACPGCQERDDVIAGLEATTRSLAAKNTALKRDRELAARRHAYWPDAVRLFEFHKKLTKPRSRASIGVDEFEAVLPFLQKHGLGLCERAIVGRVHDHFVSTRRNGTAHHHHEFGLIFRDSKNFRESSNRAPLDFQSELEQEDAAHAAELAPGQREMDV
jgi:hypothetical protein